MKQWDCFKLGVGFDLKGETLDYKNPDGAKKKVELSNSG